MKKEIMFHAYKYKTAENEPLENLKLGKVIAFTSIFAPLQDLVAKVGTITAIDIENNKAEITVNTENIKEVYNYKDIQPLCKVRTHTLLFHKNTTDLLVTYAQPMVELDAFSKKEGKRLVDFRMEKLLERNDPKYSNRITRKVEEDSLDNWLPRAVAATFSFYLDKAKKYFELSSPGIMFRSDRRTNSICLLS